MCLSACVRVCVPVSLFILCLFRFIPLNIYPTCRMFVLIFKDMIVRIYLIFLRTTKTRTWMYSLDLCLCMECVFATEIGKLAYTRASSDDFFNGKLFKYRRGIRVFSEKKIHICCTQFDKMAFFACYCTFSEKKVHGALVLWLLISFATAAAYCDSLTHSFTHTVNRIASTAMSFSFPCPFRSFYT